MSHTPTSHYTNLEEQGIRQPPQCATGLDKWSSSHGKLHWQCYFEKGGQKGKAELQ